jgi:hypothetical protein
VLPLRAGQRREQGARQRYQRNNSPDGIEEGMARIGRRIRALRLGRTTLGELSNEESSHAPCPQQHSWIRHPLVDRPAKRNAANPYQPPPVLEPTLGVADLSG